MTAATIFQFCIDYGISFVSIFFLVLLGFFAIFLNVIYPRLSLKYKQKESENDKENH